MRLHKGLTGPKNRAGQGMGLIFQRKIRLLVVKVAIGRGGVNLLNTAGSRVDFFSIKQITCGLPVLM